MAILVYTLTTLISALIGGLQSNPSLNNSYNCKTQTFLRPKKMLVSVL